MKNLLHTLPNLASIINRTPAIVDPELPLIEVILMMSQSRDNRCLLSDLVGGASPLENRSNPTEISLTSLLPRSIAQTHSAVLIVEQDRLVGIFTERDLVRLTSTQTDLDGIKIGAVMTRNPRTLVLSPEETVISALSVLEEHQIRHLPILDDRQQLLGTISTDLIRQILQPIDLLKFRSVREGMTTEVIQADAAATVLQITRLMVEHRVSSIVIVEGAKPVGIVTERDIVQFQALGLDFDRLLVNIVMSAPLFCLQLDDSLWVAQETMESKRIRRLVVADSQGELCGIVTQSNLLKSLDPLEMLRVVGTLQSQLVDRAMALERTNRELTAEIARRKQVEDELRQASRRLEQRLTAETDELSVRTEQLQSKIIEQQSCDLSLTISQQGISDFMENAMIGMHWVDVNGIIQWANRAELEMLGYSYEEYIGKPLIDFHIDRDTISDIFQRLLKNEPILGREAKMRRKDGSSCDVSVDSNALFRDGKFIHARCFTRDITAYKAGLVKISEQAALLDVATDAIIVRDLGGQIQFWNHGAEQIYGWLSAEVVGLETTQLFHPDSLPETIIASQKVLEDGAWQGELSKLTKIGTEVIVESRWTLVRDEHGDPKSILSVDTDITAKKLLQQQFFRVQRLESLGTLASGIAHDLNNILTPILGAAQLLPLTLPSLTDRNQRLLTMLVESSKRGSSLVKQILTFARGLDGIYTTLQVRHILTEIISVARQTFPKSIEIVLDLEGEDLWMVCVDATQIHQVLMNLFVNARDSMPDGGMITAIARNELLDESYTETHPNVSAGAYIKMTISDTGIGMNSATIDRIFDSFFTTKESGTGLGLSTVQGIVKAHGGFINVESEVDRGSSFQVYLPAVKMQAEEELIAVPELFDGHGQLVLVVDDEVSVREITRHSLEIYNYHAMLAHDGVEALVLYAQNWRRIDVVMVDMMMPHLDTPSLIQALQRINPTVRIIAMSGSATNEGIVEQYGLQAFLIKPFTTIDMMQALANINDTSVIS